jgi:EmrB/QacA subfamily drug resistance transporter
LPELDPNRWKALAVVCAAFFMTVLDVSIVNVALPSIGRSLHFTEANLQWVITAYAITFGGFLLLGGRAADLLGRRRVFMVGVVVFTGASFLCGLAWSEGVLIAARAIQGLGAAIISPAALSIITTTFDEGAERNKALGIWGALGGSGAAVGVLAGGVLTKYLGWEWIFFVNVPVGVLVAVLAPRIVRESREARDHTQDYAGAITITAGLAILVYGVSEAPNHHWLSGWTISRLVVAAVLLGAFLFIETRAKDPLMPFDIFRIRTVAGANVAGLLLGGVVFANFFLLTLYVQDVLHWSALKTGGTFIATAGTAIVWAGLAQALVTKVGVKPVMVAGFVAMIAGMAWYTQIPVHASYWSDLLPGYLLVGFALPFSFIPVSIAALAGVAHHEAGLASGLINTSQQVGGALGLAILATIANGRTADVAATGAGLPTALTEGFQRAFTVGAGFAIVGAILAAVVVSGRQSREHAAAAQAEGRQEPVPIAA